MTKRILITGRNSYVGNQLAEWLNKESEKYSIVKESVRDGKWKEIDFSNFDVVVHVAGIAHLKESKENVPSYYKINRDLAVSVAKEAKNAGVSQFVFISTMNVYGIEEGTISRSTEENPKTAYGKSKLEAEILIRSLHTNDFIVSVLRPPMIYGVGCKGNYQLLSRFSKRIRVFPAINNNRSMLYIDNLSEIIKIIIEKKKHGYFFPQNQEFVNTSNMVKKIRGVHKKDILLLKGFSRVIDILKKRNEKIRKVFGDLVYDKELSSFEEKYNVVSFEESIRITELKDGLNE